MISGNILTDPGNFLDNTTPVLKPKLSFEDLKDKGFTPLHEKILKGFNSFTYVYRFNDKLVLMVQCNLLAQRRFDYPFLKFKGFLPSLPDELNLLVEVEESSQTTYKLIPLDGKNIYGKGLERWSSGNTVQFGQEIVDQALKDPLDSQLKKLGFNELFLEVPYNPSADRIFVKEVIQTGNDEPKVFIVMCNKNKLANIFTSFYEDGKYVFEGEIVGVEWTKPTVVLQNKKGKLTSIEFQERDNSHEDYLAFNIRHS